ncbi:hypothetical protein CDAR_39731 [Caerostris darwini]|uniref:Uncharacterized protein n=1 Tax=Caerostris darwini TaxID=1538125 RepID=A0AAV4U6G7_9ARAC|nr:hypothetical protein CDAR_39731 [Caerostris darwini]
MNLRKTKIARKRQSLIRSMVISRERLGEESRDVKEQPIPLADGRNQRCIRKRLTGATSAPSTDITITAAASGLQAL